MLTDKSSILYTSAAAVATTALNSDITPQTLSANATAGEILITANNLGQGWTIGSQLLLDGNNSNAETVIITAAISGNSIPITALQNNHIIGCAVFNVTVLSQYIAIASRFFDEETHYPAGWGYENWTEMKESRINNYGNLSIALSKPLVQIGDISSVSIQEMHNRGLNSILFTDAYIRNNFYLEIPLPWCGSPRPVMATVTYLGGYNPLPSWVSWATNVIAARMYMERQSGYSDTIGSAEQGTMSFKKAIPADVQEMISHNRRWVV
jgi:hypothetical protein